MKSLPYIKEKSPGVYYYEKINIESICLVNNELITFLKDKARKSILKRSRLCIHQSPSDTQQEMIIVVHRDSYIAPHRHLKFIESFMLVEGEADLILFDEDGHIDSVVTIRPYSGNQNDVFFYRMPVKKFHSIRVLSEFIVFIEATSGPFESSNQEYATWAPDYSNSIDGNKYINSIQQGYY